QRIVRVVVAGHHDNAVFRPRKLRDDVVDWKLSFRSVGGEDVVLDLIALQVRGDVVLYLLVTGAAQRTRTEGHNLFHVLHSTVAVEGRERSLVGRKTNHGMLGRGRCRG